MTKKRVRNLFVVGGILMLLPFLFSVNSLQQATLNADEVNWAEKQLSQLTLEEKIGQFFMIAAYSGKGESHLLEIENSIKKDKIGGLIWFQGTKSDFITASKRMQLVSKTPLIYGMDAEWGVSMRLEGEKRFPYAYTLGAADNVQLTKRIAEMMAQECQELGIHISFGPVADVHSTPDNPVIGFRSFGENPEKVGNHVTQFVKGFEENGIMSNLKHFPGHGNTTVDSHLDLPIIHRSKAEIDAVDWLPFREGIRNGAASVMVGHLNVPALDPSGTPSSLSKIIIKDYLQTELGFKGLIISDALNMKAVADRYGKAEVAVLAFQAGCDILVCPESIPEAIQALKKKVESGAISMDEINARCLKVLKSKEKYVLKKWNYKTYTEGEKEWARNETFEKSTCLLKNEETLPLSRMDGKKLHISIGENGNAFAETLDLFGDFKHQQLDNEELMNESNFKGLSNFETIVVSIHAASVRPKNHFGITSHLATFLNKLPNESKIIVSLFGNPLALSKYADFPTVDALIVAYENNENVQNRVAQQIVGAIPFQGKLPFTLNNTYKRTTGEMTQSNGRLKFSQPEELGIDPHKFDAIDKIVADAIALKVFPGCQIVAAVKGKIIFRKSYGSHRYNDEIVEDDHLYDIASITKIAGSTVSIMKLQSEGKFSLDKQLKDYIPEVTKESVYSDIVLRDMLAHRAGLKAWLPFYTKTLVGGKLNPAIYSTVQQPGFTLKVENELYMRNDFVDSMYAQILAAPLGAKKYLYSDVGYYFIKKIIEKESQQGMDAYLTSQLYAPMGVTNIGYNPYVQHELKRLVQTEDDKIFRKKLIHGHVHDQGAAMLGGVGGHAGIFSTATDLAALMQLFLNKGSYGGVQYLQPEVVEEYTKVQFAGNRRGAGFDKPQLDGSGGTCTSVASMASFGHSGFTGTLAWADPVTEINFVFLSNRVYPDAENWQIVKLNTRTNIQRVIYEAVSSSTKK